MPRVSDILTVSSTILLVLICGINVSAYTSPRKFDEFGSLNHCDVTARLDNYAIQLQERPSEEAYIIAYAPPLRGERLLEIIKEYLIETRGLAAKRIKTRYGGRNNDLHQPRIELWIIPKRARLPEPITYETNVETFKGLLGEQRAGDDFGVYVTPEMGPGIGGTTDASFADVLNQQKNAMGYIVVYRGEDLTPGAWRIIGQEKVDYLKTFNLNSDRLKVIFGSAEKKSRLQLWVLPKDAPPPAPDAGPEPPLAKSVKAGDFYAHDLGNDKNQTNLFTRLTAILRAEKTVRAFLVVRLEVPLPLEPGEEGETAAEELGYAGAVSADPIEETEPADLTKLVEKWRVELANTHKIGPDRIIVLFTTAREMESSQVSLWIVPKGQPLPDPNEEENEEEGNPSPSSTPATPKSPA